MSVIIVGGGIIGTSTAYFLAKLGISATIVDVEDGVARAASGKAGGFLARDWCSHYEMDLLAREGFDLHMELAKSLKDTCDYRCVDTFSASFSFAGKDAGRVVDEHSLPGWVNPNAHSVSRIGSTVTTAQVHPEKLTKELFRQAQVWTNNATQLLVTRAVGLEFADTNDKPRVTGVRVTSRTAADGAAQVLPATFVLLATGPWSSVALDWLPPGCLPANRFRGHRAHAVVLRPDPGVKPGVDASCLFTEYRDAEGSCSPEVYPRPDGTVYICGLSDDKPVPESAQKVKVDAWRVSRLREMAGGIAPSLASAELVSGHACYLPLSPDGVPAIGRVSGVSGLYLATGHSCWGILTGPITGRFVAALLASDRAATTLASPLADGARDEEEVKVASQLVANPGFRLFDPARFALPPGSKSRLRTNKLPD